MKKLKISRTLKNFLISLSSEEFGLLEENILRDGIRDPIVLWGQTILDGHNRYKIATRHGLPFRTEEIDLQNIKEAKVWMIKNQLGKRNLSTFSRAEYALRLEEFISEEARKNQVLGGKKVRLNSDEAIDKGSVLGSYASCSRDTLFRVKKLVGYASKEELIELRGGELSINAAYNRASIREHEEKIKSSPFPKGKYRIILADPPWKYSSYPRVQTNTTLPPYPTMGLDELCDLPVRKLTTPSSMLFLWTTSAMLENAFQVMKAWGFKYTGSSFIWSKTTRPFIRGNYNLVSHEMLLIGKVRKSANFAENKSPSVIEAPRTRHSEKPAVFYEIIEGLGYSGTKLELFSRRKRKGWTAWGNQIEEP